jgi:ribosomal protein S13
MANNTATRQALIHIGFTQAAAQAIVDEQGIDSLGEITLLKDEEITTLCKIVQ